MAPDATPAPATTGRLFAALWPDAALRRGLQAWQSAYTWSPRARPTPARDLHLTLVFIGAVPAIRLTDIERGLRRPAPDFELVLDTPRLWHGRLAAVEASELPPALAGWQADLADALRALGITIETRPYRPHVTLARQAGGSLLPARPPPPLRWVPRGHVLAVRDGGHYRVLHRYRRGG